MPDMQRAATPEGLIDQLVALLDVERLDTDLYRGGRQPGGVGRVFGGQVIGQALQAAQKSVDPPKIAHSLHAYFMRPGNEDLPIIYRVVRDFDGGSFANRRIVAMQDGKPILNMTASFHVPEEGFAHQAPMPDVPPPEGLRSERELREAARDRIPDASLDYFLRPRPIEIRPCAPRDWGRAIADEPVQHSWFRAVAPLPDDAGIQRAALAYTTDMMLLGTCIRPHAIDMMTARVQTASLDHAVWLHAPVRIDDWLLYTTDSPWSGGARGFNRGRIYTRDGTLVASTAQEGLIRRRT